MRHLRLWLFFKLLRWFCAEELDQWERWQIRTKYGKVFIEISRYALNYESAYEDMTD